MLFPSSKRFLALPLLITAGVIVLSAVAFAQQAVQFYTDYPSVVIGEGQELSLTVKLDNSGTSPAEAQLSVTGPEDWKARFETSSYPTLTVTAVRVPPSTDKGKGEAVLKFKASPPKDAAPGKYTFTLTAKSPDGKILGQFPVTVTYNAKKPTEEKSKENKLTLSVDYPSLEGSAGKDIQFMVQIKNQSDKDRIVELSAQLPFGWRGYFSPQYQSQHITSFKINSNGTERIQFTVTPPYGVKEGKYPITFAAKAGDETETLDLTAVVTGTPELHLGSEAEVTGTGDTRNINATAGKERHFTLYLWNKGSAPVRDLSFYASKPKGWEVKFKPDHIDAIAPLAETGKPETVDVTIIPAGRAIPGDYQVTITAAGADSHESMDLRVSVGASMGWGWVGVGVVVIVIAGLTGIFVRLGRR